VFRHVSPAFAEDPVRILRVARFAARFTDFTLAPETNELMRSMVQAGEVDALVPERVWQELARGLMEKQPSRMFEVLRGCGALARIFPELDALWGVPQPAAHHPEVDTGVHVMMVVDMSAQLQQPLEVRFAALVHDLGKGATPPEEWPRHHGHEAHSVRLVREACVRLRVPNEARDLALMTAREHGNVARAFEMRADTLQKLFERCDAFRKPERFAQMLKAAECDQRGRTGYENREFPQEQYLLQALSAARAVDAGRVAGETARRYPDQPARIPEAIRDARVEAIKPLWQSARSKLTKG
jgi:tRNA nucleotidyltransferase (CCA-adding enzyme)